MYNTSGMHEVRVDWQEKIKIKGQKNRRRFDIGYLGDPENAIQNV